MQLSFMGRKQRTLDKDHPYAVFQSGDWTWQVYKSWQVHDDKPYARWFCRVVTPMTGELGDLGDVYVTDVIRYGQLVEVDGREPTNDELKEVTSLLTSAMIAADPTA